MGNPLSYEEWVHLEDLYNLTKVSISSRSFRRLSSASSRFRAENTKESKLRNYVYKKKIV